MSDEAVRALARAEDALETICEDLFVIESALRCEWGVDDLGAVSNNAMRLRERLRLEIAKLDETRKAIVESGRVSEDIRPIGGTKTKRKPALRAKGAN